jgi:hypothetical protein
VRTSADRPLSALVAILVLFGLLVLVSFWLGNGSSAEIEARSDGDLTALEAD